MKRLLLLIFIVTTAHFAQSQQGTGTRPEPVVRFYPNPAISFVTFDFTKAYEAGFSIQIYNFPQGKKVHEAKNMVQRTTVNLNEYTRGVYIYQLRDKFGRMVESGKFQVSK